MSVKKAAAHLEQVETNLAKLERVKRRVTAQDLETLEQGADHALPDELRSQMIYYIAVIAEGVNNIIGTPERAGLAPDWFTAEETLICKQLIGLRNIMLHGYLESADDRIFWRALTGADYQVFCAAISRLSQQHL